MLRTLRQRQKSLAERLRKNLTKSKSRVRFVFSHRWSELQMKSDSRKGIQPLLASQVGAV